MKKTREVLVSVIMGSQSDWEQMSLATEVLKEFDVPYEARVISAHRTPEEMLKYAKEAKTRGIKVIIAGAGGSAHLPGMVASHSEVPVIGVPIVTKTLNGIDSLLSIIQMPYPVAVATMPLGSSGAKNAAILAIQILSLFKEDYALALKRNREELREKVLNTKLPKIESE